MRVPCGVEILFGRIVFRLIEIRLSGFGSSGKSPVSHPSVMFRGIIPGEGPTFLKVENSRITPGAHVRGKPVWVVIRGIGRLA